MRSRSLRKVAVVGRGTAGSLAAASVSRLHPDDDHELHHIFDSRIPIIGVGEGSWPSLVQELHELTDLPHEAVQQRLKGTRKYGVAFEGWGRRDRDFTHYFTPQQVSYAYHLSADLLADLLHESTRARHIDAKVHRITRVDGGAQVEFEGRAPERYDLVFDARGFPKELDPNEHIDISFIPTNTAVIRRCPAIVEEENGPVLHHTYTRAVARPHGWIFVIPLTVHTSYGYIFNRDVSSLEDVEADFDAFLDSDGVTEFEQRAVIPFPNFVHRRIYDGAVARIGNAAAFMEPLEATAIVSAQLQIRMVLLLRFNRPGEHLERDAPVVNRFLVDTMLRYGLFVGWHYSAGSRYDSEFWRYARDRAWPKHRTAADPEAVGCDALGKFDDMIGLLNRPVIDKADRDRMCAVPLTSYAQVSQGLGC
ncbi:MAG: tryptophan 7-halogenase [Rhodospirillaceae bacterium]|nr:tryptophan 7-halogenase [Rhodospirillaceae bacterium]MYH35762.1 tryptophan 7-halogenase [Rhodospirillaceae bacterium]MYK58132.1 tryptophan 7-halogenase [Rhodospirillaceae bacterium]